MIDPILLNYLVSGKAWLLIGSGVSSQMGYPSWEELAKKAIDKLRQDRLGLNMSIIDKAFIKKDFPAVFQYVYEELNDQLLSTIEEDLKPNSSGNGKIYDLLARWPIRVYLTTNWDDEIQKHLSKNNKDPYICYKNKEADMARLIPDLDGAIFKLHGDLTTSDGLIMTRHQYDDITNGADWEYWRTKMTSIFQMNKIIIIGHSLTDQNVKHVLELAKKGSGVTQPICWLAPDVSMITVREYLEQYRIRVISYDNRDGTHQNLFRLLETIDKFVPKRNDVKLSKPMAEILKKNDDSEKGLAGFYVFNQMLAQENFEEKRVSILLGAIQSVSELHERNKQTISIFDLLTLSGWPESTPIPPKIAQQVFDKGFEQGWFTGLVNDIKLNEVFFEISSKKKEEFNHIHQRFRESLNLRITRLFPDINPELSHKDKLTDEIDNAIISFFQHDGLTLSQCLFAKSEIKSPLPTTLAAFLTEASCKFDDYLSRQIFSKVTLDIFINPTSSEREYLGRVSQGYFAFHALGVLGDVAIQQLRHVKESVWLIDSDAIIQTMALYTDTNSIFYDTFQQLKTVGARYFVTDRLANEAYWHLHYADELISKEGEASPEILAAAEGTLPFNKENLFLRGFISWQAAGNACEWKKYLSAIIQTSKLQKEAFQEAMIKKGFEIVPFDNWPGFTIGDYKLRDEYTDKISAQRNNVFDTSEDNYLGKEDRIRKKSEPESEAIIIIEKERQGTYHILSEDPKPSYSRFISHTGVLNAICEDQPITWRTEDFLHFVSSLPISADNASKSAYDAFQLLLISFAQSGITVMEDQVVIATFGSTANEAVATISEQEKNYVNILNKKYSIAPNELMKQLDIRQQPIAAIQIANEAFQRLCEQQEHSIEEKKELEKKLRIQEERLKKLKRFENKLNERATKAKKNRRKKARKKR